MENFNLKSGLPKHRSEKRQVISFVIGFFLSGFFLGYWVNMKEDKICQDKISPKIAVQKIDTLQIAFIYSELLKQKVLYPELVIQKIKLETGNLNSRLCRISKNLLGIKRFKGSKSINSTKEGYCVYKSYSDCLSDYKVIQGRYLKIIAERYAEDKNYIQKLKSFKN